MKKYNFVAIVGSLRKQSYNKMLLGIAQTLLPNNITIEVLSIDDVPLYNADIHEEKVPESVDKLNDAIKAADALIFFTPEYNYSVPGVLKNVIDHVSSSPKKPFDLKPIGIMGVSSSLLGTARAQYHLRQIMVAVNAYVFSKPEVMITEAKKKFNKDGHLTDKTAEKLIGDFMEGFVKFVDRFIQQ